MDAEIAGGSCQQDIAQRLSLSVSETLQGVIRQYSVNGGVVEVGGIITSSSGNGLASDQSGQLTRRGISKDFAVSHVHAHLVGLNDDACHHQRGTAQFKEVVIGTHFVHLQNVSKDIAEGSLSIVGRGLVFATDGHHGLWQCLHIGLAVGGHGHRVKLQISGRYHVLCQTLGDFGLHRCGLNHVICSVIGA